MEKHAVLALNTFRFCPKCGGAFRGHSEKSNRCADCGFVYFLNPSAAVAVFVRNELGELLLCVRGKEPALGMLDLPGGFSDMGETIEQAAVRELREELGVEVGDLSYLFSFPNVYRYSELDIPTLDMFFECKISSATPITPADDVAEAHFVALDDICLEQIGLDSIRKAVAHYIATRKNKNQQ